MNILLQVKGLEVTYGPVRAVKGVDLEVPKGEIRAILGANGAGKSSIIRAIMGLVKSRRGTLTLAGRELQRLPPHTVNQLGIAWVPEGRPWRGRWSSRVPGQRRMARTRAGR